MRGSNNLAPVLDEHWHVRYFEQNPPIMAPYDRGYLEVMCERSQQDQSLELLWRSAWINPMALGAMQRYADKYQVKEGLGYKEFIRSRDGVSADPNRERVFSD